MRSGIISSYPDSKASESWSAVKPRFLFTALIRFPNPFFSIGHTHLLAISYRFVHFKIISFKIIIHVEDLKLICYNNPKNEIFFAI